MEEMVANPAVETTPGIRASGKDNARSHHPAEESPVIGLMKKFCRQSSCLSCLSVDGN
ncbi:hypothetical protein N6H13_30985 [Paenibacillus sp. CC-CFT742]|nr:hypothetical protein [Paenibacillus sp. CC-CFT742]WJH29237.1 hypothetical protein N6H13_30985 [Paenibacillus sp. CC-CFT742]